MLEVEMEQGPWPSAALRTLVTESRLCKPKKKTALRRVKAATREIHDHVREKALSTTGTAAGSRMRFSHREKLPKCS